MTTKIQMGKGTYYCPNCGYPEIRYGAVTICPNCGYEMYPVPTYIKNQKENHKTQNKMKPIFKTQTEKEVLVDEEIEVKEELNLILYNDDVNTFAWVMECLCEICKHSSIQAEQCTLIIHHNGKCSVKRGTYNKLRPMCEALLDRKLSAVIE